MNSLQHLVTAGVLACCTLCTRLDAQIHVGEVTVTLGAPQSRTLQQLRSHYLVDTLTADKWVVTTQEDHFILGYVTFTDGQVSAITRFWQPRDSRQSSQADVARAVINALLTLKAGQQCKVEDNSFVKPTIENQEIAVICGPRTVSIGLWRSSGKLSLIISEELRKT